MPTFRVNLFNLKVRIRLILANFNLGRKVNTNFSFLFLPYVNFLN